MTMGHTTIAAYRPTKIHPQRQVALEPRVPSYRPSWLLLIIVTAAVAGLTWGIMQQRMPEIDPRQVIANNLSAAKLAIDAKRYVDPPEHSAVHYYTSVIALDPDNQEALAGLTLLTNHFIEKGKAAILDGHFAEAALAIDSVRRVEPTNRRLEFLESELRKAVEAHVAALNSETRANDTSTGLARSVRSSPALRKEQLRAPLKSERPLAPSNEISTELTQAPPPSAATDPIARLGDVGNVDSRGIGSGAAYADIEHAYETAAQQLALQARAQESERPAVAPVLSGPSIEERLRSTGSGPEVPSTAALKPLKLVEPHYPQAAQVRGLEGWVDLALTIAPSGDVIDARVEEREGSRSFERAALLAVRQWKYEPYTPSESSAAPQEILVRVGFRLE
jgi:TonB family protein